MWVHGALARAEALAAGKAAWMSTTSWDTEHTYGMSCTPPVPVDIEWTCPVCGASFRRRFAPSAVRL